MDSSKIISFEKAKQGLEATRLKKAKQAVNTCVEACAKARGDFENASNAYNKASRALDEAYDELDDADKALTY